MRSSPLPVTSRVPSRGVEPLHLVNPHWAEEVLAVYARLPDDQARLRLAVELARENVLCRTGGPFGAVIVDEQTGMLLALGVDGVERLDSSLAHAEIVALAEAEARLSTRSLADGQGRYVLYASCEPCAMCLGAILWSGVPRIVFAARREDAEGIGFDEGPPLRDAIRQLRRRGIRLEAGALRDEAVEVLRLSVERGGPVYGSG